MSSIRELQNASVTVLGPYDRRIFPGLEIGFSLPST